MLTVIPIHNRPCLQMDQGFLSPTGFGSTHLPGTTSLIHVGEPERVIHFPTAARSLDRKWIRGDPFITFAERGGEGTKKQT